MHHIYGQNEDKCTGCAACSAICANNCIEMKMNKRGFWYAHIDEEKCVHCDKCAKVCSSRTGVKDVFETSSEYYAAKLKNPVMLLESQSGGAFWALAQEFCKRNGIIYGCIMDAQNHIRHIRATVIRDCVQFRKSKYVQSYVDKEIYQCIYQDLMAKRDVLFVGTPCQIYGIRKYLIEKKCRSDKLLLVDIICHGVPSPGLFAEFLQWMEEKRDKKIGHIIFRDKRVFGWGDHKETIVWKNGFWTFSSIWTSLYYQNYSMNDICESCNFRKKQRVGDITIGDGWNVNKKKWPYKESLGMSCVLINTEKGKQDFENAKQFMYWKEIQMKEVNDLEEKTKSNELKEKFWTDYEKHGIDYVIKKYADCTKVKLVWTRKPYAVLFNIIDQLKIRRKL